MVDWGIKQMARWLDWCTSRRFVAKGEGNAKTCRFGWIVSKNKLIRVEVGSKLYFSRDEEPRPWRLAEWNNGGGAKSPFLPQPSPTHMFMSFFMHFLFLLIILAFFLTVFLFFFVIFDILILKVCLLFIIIIFNGVITSFKNLNARVFFGKP